ncbi:MAG: magnesium and cobalt transport protein CorA, partial [Candidatus Micrarchaeota archaeon]
MANKRRRLSKKAALPPGTLIHIGEQKTEKVRIRLIDYTEDQLEEKEVKQIEECFAFKEKPTTTWINIDGLHRVEIIEKIGKQFGIHSLVLEDILNTEQRPKIEDFEGHLFVVLKMLSYDENELKTEQFSLILGSNFLITFQEKEGDVFDPVRERIRKGKIRVRKHGVDYLAYALMDAVVDNYFVILEKIGEKIEDLQQEVVSDPKPETLQAIYKLKQTMISIRKSVWPLREVIGALQRSDSDLIKESTTIYLRDVYDH